MSADQGSILDKIISTQQVSHRENFKPHAALAQLLQTLTERERQVLERRFGLAGHEFETLENIGQSFQVTRERVRQIQRLAVQKLKDGKAVTALVAPIRQVVVEILEGDGGLAPAERLRAALIEASDGASEAEVDFYLNELLVDVVAGCGGEGVTLVPGWCLRSAQLDAVEALVQSAIDFITRAGVPVSETQLASHLVSAKLMTPLGQPLSDDHLAINLLEASRQVRRNTFGEWGLSHWETVNPKRMNDKIYLVLKKHGQPLHFRDITKLINEQHFDHKVAYPPTVHNELIMDRKYVLVGRGIYALKEWGYQPGVVADILAHILQERGPLTRDDLVAEVLKQRLVKRGTIHLALTNRKRFQHLPDGRYAVAGGGTV